MWLNSLSDDLDYSDWWHEQTREQSREQGEKKWDSSKWMAWIKKTRKDEKKAKKDDDFLYETIIDLIKNKDFDILIPLIVDMFKYGIPSNLILGGVSLVFSEATYIIRTNYQPWVTKMILDKTKAKAFNNSIGYTKTIDIIEFDDNNINEAIKNRINIWIEDIMSVISFDPSSIMTEKCKNLIKEKESRKIIVNFLSWVFVFFLFALNISISKDRAFLYSDFILEEVYKKLISIDTDSI